MESEIKNSTICNHSKENEVYAGVGKSRFTVLCMEKHNPRINNNTRINCVLCTHNCKPTFACPCMYALKKKTCIGSICWTLRSTDETYQCIPKQIETHTMYMDWKSQHNKEVYYPKLGSIALMKFLSKSHQFLIVDICILALKLYRKALE